MSPPSRWPERRWGSYCSLSGTPQVCGPSRSVPGLYCPWSRFLDSFVHPFLPLGLFPYVSSLTRFRTRGMSSMVRVVRSWKESTSAPRQNSFTGCPRVHLRKLDVCPLKCWRVPTHQRRENPDDTRKHVTSVKNRDFWSPWFVSKRGLPHVRDTSEYPTGTHVPGRKVSRTVGLGVRPTVRYGPLPRTSSPHLRYHDVSTLVPYKEVWWPWKCFGNGRRRIFQSNRFRPVTATKPTPN